MASRAGGAALAALGGIGASASAYLYWHDGRDATEFPIERLFQTGVTGDASSYWSSVAIVFGVVAALGVIGAVLRSRFVLTLGWLIGVLALAAWVTLQAVDAVDNNVDLSANDIQAGAWACALALVVMLAGIVGMGPKKRDDDEDEAPSLADDDTTTSDRAF